MKRLLAALALVMGFATPAFADGPSSAEIANEIADTSER